MTFRQENRLGDLKYNDNRYLVKGTSLDSQTVSSEVIFTGDVYGVRSDTGFLSPENITVSYDSTTRKVTLTGTSITLFYDGLKILDGVTSWVSTAHDDTAGSWYLYYDGSDYVWSSTIWSFDQAQIAYIYYGATNKIGFREVHGLMPWQTHRELHETIGTYKVSGGDFGDYIVDGTVDTDNRPSISNTIIADEDLRTSVTDLPNDGPYTQMYLTGVTSDVAFATSQVNIVPLSTTYPAYNYWNGTTWSQEALPASFYMNIWVIATPASSDSASQPYRYLFMQGQNTFNAANYDAALVEDPRALSFGTFTNLFKEFCIIAQITIQRTGALTGTFKIKKIQNIFGSRLMFFSSTGLTGLYLKLDQTTPQTVENGIPVFAEGISVNPYEFISSNSSTTSGISFNSSNVPAIYNYGDGLYIIDQTAVAANVGGKISLYGVYNAGGSTVAFSRIRGYKTNAVSGEYGGGFAVDVLPYGGSLTTAMTIKETSTINFSTVADAGEDTDKFLVLDSSGDVDYRTGAEVLSDIGGAPALSLTQNYLPKAATATTLNDSIVIQYGNNIGIGVADPDEKLEVNGGNVKISRGADTNEILYIHGADETSEYIGFGVGTGVAYVKAGNVGAAGTDLIFLNASTSTGVETERVRIKADGDVGIGVDPGYRLQIVDNAYGDIHVRVQGAGNEYVALGTQSGYSIITAGNAGAGDTYLIFQTSSGGGETEKMRIGVDGTITFSTVADAGEDTDKFLVLDSSGNVDYRTGDELLSDIGASSSTSISGTENYVAKFTSASTIGDSIIVNNGSAVRIQETVLGTDWVAVNDILSVESTDSYLALVSSDGGTWGSAVSLKQLDTATGSFENQWAIIRQTNGDGDGNGSLRITYGTSVNPYQNTALVIINEGGTFNLATVSDAGTDTDKFLVWDASGNVDYRTGDEVISDLGLDTRYLLLDQSSPQTVINDHPTFNAGIVITSGQYINGTGNSGAGVTFSTSDEVYVENVMDSSLTIRNSSAYSSAKAGSIKFSGKYNSGGSYNGYGVIRGYKTNTTDGQYGGGIKFDTYPYGGSLTTRMTITETGKVGIGTSSPDSTLHVHTATAGSVTAQAAADDLVVEASNDTGISILSPDGNTANLYFGSPSDGVGALLRWKFNDLLMNLGTYATGGEIAFMYGNGSEGMRLDSDGKVGVGTSAPDGTLHVFSGSAGTVTANTSIDDLVVENSADAGISILAPNDNFCRIAMGSPTDNVGASLVYKYADRKFYIGTSLTSGEIVLRTDNNVEAVRIKSDGKVGIGTSTPDSKLDVDGGAVRIAYGDYNVNIIQCYGPDRVTEYAGIGVSSGYALFTAGNYGTGNTDMVLRTTTSGIESEKVRIKSDGKVGIGTSTPSGSLDISQSSLSLIVGADLGNTSRTNATTKTGNISCYHYTNAEQPVGIAHVYSDTSTSLLSIGGGVSTLNAATQIDLYTAANTTTTVGTSRMTIKSDGKVGIGTGSPDNNLHVYAGNSGGSSNTIARVTIEDDASCALQFLSPSTTTSAIYFGDESYNDSGVIAYVHAQNYLTFYTNRVERLRIESDGGILAFNLGTSTGTDLIITAGDEICKKASALRFKEDIRDTVIDSSVLQSFRIVDFVWKETRERDFGFVAEELRDKFPGLETYSGDEIQSWDTQRMVTLLVGEVQRLQKEINELKKSIKKNEKS